MSLIFLASTLASASHKPAPTPPIATVHADIVKVTAHPDDPDLYDISVRLELQASNKPLVIPYCEEAKSGDHMLCCAQLEKLQGRKWVIAKPIYGVVMGMESTDNFKALPIAPGSHVSFNFPFSRRFFGIRDGQALRVRIGVWDNSDSWNGGRPDHVLWSSTFFSPSKPQ